MNTRRKATYYICCVCAAFLFYGCQKPNEKKYSAHINNCEAVLKYNNSILATNFSKNHSSLLNTKGSGYVTIYDGHKNEILIPPDGNLIAPKGMAIKDNYLFIADMQRIVVYNLKNLALPPRIIYMPAKEQLITDVQVKGNVLFIASPESGNIYILDITNPSNINDSTLAIYTNIPGANALFASKNYQLYIASGPMDRHPSDQNVLYVIDDIMHPEARKLTHRIGAYTGLELSEDNQKLYFYDAENDVLGELSLENGNIQEIHKHENINHEAKICVYQKKIILPNFNKNKVHVVDLRIK